MKKAKYSGGIDFNGVRPWPHELHVANILKQNGYNVVFLAESNIYTADILLNGVEFEIKSPISSSGNSLEHLLKKALRQSQNIIIDASRLKNYNQNKLYNFLKRQKQSRKQIKRLILITRKGEVIDIL